MIAHRPQIAAVVQLQEARAELGTSILIGHWVEQALQARQPDIASLTSCEKSYSPLRACQLLRVRATSERRLTPCSGSAFSSWLGSTPRSASRRSHSRTSVARPFGEWMRWLLTFIDGHIGLLTSKLKHSPLPLHSIAPRQLLRAMGICRSGAALRRIDFHHRRVDTFRRTDFPGFRRLSGSKTALILRSSAYSVSPKKAGLYSARNPCHVRPTAGRHTSPSALPPRRRSASSAPPAADRTCPAPGARAAPASTWPNMP